MKSYDDFLDDYSKIIKSFCILKHGVTLYEFINDEDLSISHRKIEELRKEFINYLLDDEEGGE